LNPDCRRHYFGATKFLPPLFSTETSPARSSLLTDLKTAILGMPRALAASDRHPRHVPHGHDRPAEERHLQYRAVERCRHRRPVVEDHRRRERGRRQRIDGPHQSLIKQQQNSPVDKY
jgi:hypothetical protein